MLFTDDKIKKKRNIKVNKKRKETVIFFNLFFKIFLKLHLLLTQIISSLNQHRRCQRNT